MSPGYIAVSQQDEVGMEVTPRYEMMWLVMELPGLMSGLHTFFCNPRTKHYSFTSIERECHIQIDRRKCSMALLQVNDTQGLYSESEVLHAFQEGLVRFMKEEYVLVDLDRLKKDSLLDTERSIGAEFRQYYQDFVASRQPV